MQKRTLLATATLTALLLSGGSLQTAPTGVETPERDGRHTPPSMGSLQTAPTGAETELAPHASGLQTMQSSEAPAGPRWGEAFDLGFWWGVLSAVVCGAFSGPGGIACGLAGAA